MLEYSRSQPGKCIHPQYGKWWWKIMGNSSKFNSPFLNLVLTTCHPTFAFPYIHYLVAHISPLHQTCIFPLLILVRRTYKS